MSNANANNNAALDDVDTTPLLLYHEGYRWVQDGWTIDTTYTQTDVDGWSYDIDWWRLNSSVKRNVAKCSAG